MVRLVIPGPEHAGQVMGYRSAFLRAGDHLDGTSALERFSDYDPWLCDVLGNMAEETVRPGLVPATTLLALSEPDGRLVGMIQVRHRLNDFLLRFGGNIGYSVHPDERRRGYAGEMLRLALAQFCPPVGIRRALVTCDAANEGSRRTILKNGGVFENEVLEGDGFTQRYWIDVRPFAVRPVEARDIEGIRGINDRALGYDVPLHETAQYVSALMKKPGNRIWVAEQQGVTAGYLHAADYDTSYRAPAKDVLSLAVDPAFQGSGMGRALLDEAHVWARQEGAKEVRLISGMDRTDAHTFYLHCGYTLRKEHKNFVRPVSQQ